MHTMHEKNKEHLKQAMTNQTNASNAKKHESLTTSIDKHVWKQILG